MSLVISRQAGEKILIGEEITVTVVEVSRGKVRLAIDAPKDVQIRRSELSEEAVAELRERRSS